MKHTKPLVLRSGSSDTAVSTVVDMVGIVGGRNGDDEAVYREKILRDWIRARSGMCCTSKGIFSLELPAKFKEDQITNR